MLRILAGLPLLAALVTTAAPIAANTANEKAESRDEMVCKAQRRTGTRFATQVCFTRTQWNEISETNKRDYAASRDRPVIDITRPN